MSGKWMIFSIKYKLYYLNINYIIYNINIFFTFNFLILKYWKKFSCVRWKKIFFRHILILSWYYPIFRKIERYWFCVVCFDISDIYFFLFCLYLHETVHLQDTNIPFFESAIIFVSRTARFARFLLPNCYALFGAALLYRYSFVYMRVCMCTFRGISSD